VDDDAKKCEYVAFGCLPGTTALHEAAAVGDIDVLGDLIERGADPDLKDYCERTPAEDGH